jgi:hypothetical protein
MRRFLQALAFVALLPSDAMAGAGCTSWTGYHEGTLASGASLTAGQSLWGCPISVSSDFYNNVQLVLTTDGDLQLNTTDGSLNYTMWWHTNTTTGDHVTMLASGFLALFDANNHPLWSSTPFLSGDPVSGSTLAVNAHDSNVGVPYLMIVTPLCHENFLIMTNHQGYPPDQAGDPGFWCYNQP